MDAAAAAVIVARLRAGAEIAALRRSERRCGRGCDGGAPGLIGAVRAALATFFGRVR